MHHLVFEINFQIHSVSLTNLVLIHLLIHLLTHLSHHPCSRHPSLLSISLQAQNLPFQQILLALDFFYTGLPRDNGTAWAGPITLVILFLVLLI